MAIRFIPNRMTMPFEELDGSPEEMITSRWAGSRSTRKIKCLSVNRIAVVNELLGFREFVGGNVLIHLPAPYGPDMPNLIATSAVVKPFGRTSAVPRDTRWADYEHVIISINYEWNTRIESSVYGLITLRETIQDVSDFVTLPTRNLYWGTGGGKEAIDAFDAPGKINYGLEWTYEITGAHTVPEQIFDPVGKLNLYAITAPGVNRTFPPYTLLYAAPVVESELTYSGTIYRIVLRFLQKNNGTFVDPKGWNWFPRISASGADITYEPITDGTDSKNIYNGMDFRGVFA